MRKGRLRELSDKVSRRKLPMMRVDKAALKRLSAAAVIACLVVISAANQFRYSALPFFRSCRYIPSMLAKDDLGQLKELAFPLYQLVSNINAYPPETNFYFAPVFEEWLRGGINWWYIYILTRYFCYPRQIFSLDRVLYGGEKEGYKNKFIQGKRYYAQLDWLTKRNIIYIICKRDNLISIVPLNNEIAGLE